MRRSAVQVRGGDDGRRQRYAGHHDRRTDQGGGRLHGGRRGLRVLVHADGARRLLHRHQVLQRHHRRMSAQSRHYRSLAGGSVDISCRQTSSLSLFPRPSPPPFFGPILWAIAVPSVTRCRCCRCRCRRGHRCAGGVRQRHLVNGLAAARSCEWDQHFSNASCLIFLLLPTEEK